MVVRTPNKQRSHNVGSYLLCPRFLSALYIFGGVGSVILSELLSGLRLLFLYQKNRKFGILFSMRTSSICSRQLSEDVSADISSSIASRFQ